MISWRIFRASPKQNKKTKKNTKKVCAHVPIASSVARTGSDATDGIPRSALDMVDTDKTAPPRLHQDSV